MKFLALLLTTCLFLSPAYAEDKKIEAKVETEAETETVEETAEDTDSPVTRYAPDHCDFEITFPDQPYTSKRCPKGTGKCYDLTGYTMVYDLRSTVDISVTCVPSTTSNYNRYNERVIKAALNGMVKRVGISEYSLHTEEKEDFRHGVLSGSSKQNALGMQGKIYNAQLWVGQNSIFTMEAKLTGPTHREAEAVFSDILKSVQVKED